MRSSRTPSPAHTLYPVLTAKKSMVEAFVTTFEIQWGHGREPQDPTHQVIFFNDAKEKSVFLKIKFVVAGNESTFPGLVAELSLRSDLIGEGAERMARLDRLFSALIETLQPDLGYVLLPGHPENEEWHSAPEAGWLTYVARPASAAPLSVPPPSVAVPFAAGVKIMATSIAPDNYDGAADAIAAVHAAINGAG